MKKDLQKIIEQFVDLVLPELTPYETNLYLLLFRKSFIQNGSLTVRVGKRTIADKIGKGARTEENISYKQVSKSLKGLEEKGVIKVGDTNREGTLYTILLPEEIPFVKEKLAIVSEPEEEKVTSENTTLDHLIPQHKGGKHTKENLKTSCLICNSIKSGKTYEEAAPFLLKSIQERKARNNND